MIEYIILIVALVAALGSIYIIVRMPAPAPAPAPVAKPAAKPDTQTEVNTQYKKDISGNPFDPSGNLLLDIEIAPPYATDTINSVDDYEYSMIFQNEGDRAMTKASRDLLMSQYPMDWTVQPPSSDLFQQGLASFKESFQNPQEMPKKNPYTEIDGSLMVPPVYTDEKDILATYTPKKAQELTTYAAEDARVIVNNIYKAKGLVAKMKKTGDNTYTIMETRPINEKIVYEGDETNENTQTDASGAPTSSQAVPSAGEGTFTVPATVDNFKVPDPFFTVNPSDRARDGKWDYATWTPGLERSFAPTEPQTNWY